MSDDSQRLSRAWDAIGLGPIWVVRGPSKDSSGAAALSAPGDAAQGGAKFCPPAADGAQGDVDTGPTVASRADIAQMDWDSLQYAVADCRRCGLCASRTRTVFGVGDRRPKWLIVGEAPGAQEDKQGEPFVGEAGQLLDAMLASVGASRDTGVFILNVLKCRPPGNRDPAPDEVASCAQYLQRQVALLSPQMIFTMGRFAAQALLQTDEGIGALRQRVHRITVGNREIPLVAGYHPAYLLRRPEEKLKAWQDICLARSISEPTSSLPSN